MEKQKLLDSFNLVKDDSENNMELIENDINQTKKIYPDFKENNSVENDMILIYNNEINGFATKNETKRFNVENETKILKNENDSNMSNTSSGKIYHFMLSAMNPAQKSAAAKCNFYI